MARPMRNHDAPEVYDPFLGSGTTMVAAQNLNRKCYGIEISPDYCAVILQRMRDAFPAIEINRSTTNMIGDQHARTTKKTDKAKTA